MRRSTMADACASVHNETWLRYKARRNVPHAAHCSANASSPKRASMVNTGSCPHWVLHVRAECVNNPQVGYKISHFVLRHRLHQCSSESHEEDRHLNREMREIPRLICK
jgi:hypothetical protein